MEKSMIYEAIAAINGEIGAIGKNQTNQQQKFKYRGIDDVMNELHGLFAKHKVFITTTQLDYDVREYEYKDNYGNEKMTFRTRARYRFEFIATDGSKITSEIVGEAMDNGDKGMNKAASIALKYALLQMFLIPTEEQKDPDSECHTPQHAKDIDFVPFVSEIGTINTLEGLRKWHDEHGDITGYKIIKDALNSRYMIINKELKQTKKQ